MCNMDEWIQAVSKELGINTPVDTEALLDLARIAAHRVERPAAPITTYLLGFAVARGLDPSASTSKIAALAESWPAGGAVPE